MQSLTNFTLYGVIYSIVCLFFNSSDAVFATYDILVIFNIVVFD